MFETAAIGIQMMPVALLLWRGEKLIPSAWARWALMLFYVGQPNSEEYFACLTNSQWQLALISLMFVILEPPAGLIAFSAQCVALTVAGLTGPFCVLLAPVAVWHAFTQGPDLRRKAVIQAAILVMTSVFPVVLMRVGSGAPRPNLVLGASVTAFLRILADRVFVSGSVGSVTLRELQSTLFWPRDFVPWIISLIGIALSIYAFWRGGRAFQKLAVFGGAILASGLASPLAMADSMTAWQVLDLPGCGARYEFILTLAWFSVFLVLASQRLNGVRIVALMMFPLFLIGIVRDWSYNWPPNDIPKRFHRAAKNFAHAAPGTVVVFAVYPPHWDVTLVKK